MAVERELTVGSPATQLRELARRLGVAGFWGWWLGELARLVPAGPRAAWQRRRMRPVLAFDGARATLWRPVIRDGAIAMEAQSSVPLEGDAAEIASAGRHALGTQAGDGIAVTLALPPRTVLRKQLTLPLAVEENVRQVVAYDLDRHTPFKSDELYFDARVTDRDAAHGMLRIDLAAVLKSKVDPLLRHAASWGATVAAIAAEGPQQAAVSSLNLLPTDMRDGRAPWRRWQFWLPVALLALFALGATTLPLWQKREHAIALLHDAERARADAAVSETLRAELDRQVGDYNFALERKFTFAPTVQTLDDVTRLMPDDTWLTQLEVRSARGKDMQRELTLRGESANAGRLVSVLEDSKLFTQAAPRSPITKIQPGPGEIFDVSAQLKPLALPSGAPVVIASTTAPAATSAASTPPPSAPAKAAAPAAPPPAKAATPPSAAAPATSATPPSAATPAAMEPQEEPAAMDAMEPDGAAPGAVAPPPTAAAPAAAPPASVAAPPPANVRPQLPRGRAGKAREAAAASGVRQ